MLDSLKLGQNRRFGLLLLRLGIGGMFMVHGAPKLFGGPELWAQLGGAMANLGITVWPTFWGAAAAFSEFFGGLCLILGVLFTPACFFLFNTMFVASVMHLAQGDGFKGASHAIELGIVFLALLWIGPGQWALGGSTQGASSSAAASKGGSIKKLIRNKGFGFISTADGQEIFFHQNSLMNAKFKSLREGLDVNFDIRPTPKGLTAVNIHVR